MRRETFHTPGPLTLDLRVPSGEITLESVDGEQTIVELDASGWNDDVRGNTCSPSKSRRSVMSSSASPSQKYS